MELQVKTKNGSTIDLYHESYALIVGNGNYTNGWDTLPGAIKDVEEVATALEKNGFNVTLKTDVTRNEFDGLFSTFVREHGRDEDNRLIFYYAGHGHTEKMATDEQLGYLVMVDAPLPAKDTKGFDKASIDMVSLVTEAKKIRARHVLYMFDSCFSGAMLNLREQVTPESITDQVKHPVRQFITAGRADEPVPDHSTFKQAFLDLLTGLDREPIPDGYITGEELGLYLKSKVPEYNPSQHPQYGKINDPKLNKGDFVFLAGGKIQWEKPAPEAKDGRVHITSAPASGKLYIDGAYSGETPHEISLSPGAHEIVVEKNGYKTQKETVQVRVGKEINVKILLEAVGGSIAVKSEPSSANVYLDGRLIGETPDTITDLKPLRYNVTVKKEGYKDWSKTVELGSGEEVAITADLVKVAVAPKVGDTWKESVTVEVRNPKSEIQNPKAGDTWTEPITGMEFVWVPGGSFEMGDLFGGGDVDEKHIRTVRLDGFWLGKYEVTQGEWQKIMGNNPSYFKNGDNYPVESVSWNDAQEFIKKLNSKHNGRYTFRLPSEAEWEYAARSGGRKENWAGTSSESSLGSYAWYDDNSGGETHPVGQKQPNGLRLYDMSGNVWEWCEDVYVSDYSKVDTDNPIYKGSGSDRVVRGGSWYGTPMFLRASDRGSFTPAGRNDDLGFRLARTP